MESIAVSAIETFKVGEAATVYDMSNSVMRPMSHSTPKALLKSTIILTAQSYSSLSANNLSVEKFGALVTNERNA